jgi:uncharacterized membrane protein
MAGLLTNFRNTVIVSVILALIVLFAYSTGPHGTDEIFWQGVLRWLHVFSGILWIGLLYYFNFVQTRVMPDIPAELKPAVSKYITPEALFWFRWSALATVLIGLGIAGSRHFLVQTLTFGQVGADDPSAMKQYALLGLGMWLGIIMMINVWGFIWPNQKRALGLVEADADTKAKSARLATLFSRTNMLLSIPMLVSMTMSQTIFG